MSPRRRRRGTPSRSRSTMDPSGTKIGAIDRARVGVHGRAACGCADEIRADVWEFALVHFTTPPELSSWVKGRSHDPPRANRQILRGARASMGFVYCLTIHRFAKRAPDGRFSALALADDENQALPPPGRRQSWSNDETGTRSLSKLSNTGFRGLMSQQSGKSHKLLKFVRTPACEERGKCSITITGSESPSRLLRVGSRSPRMKTSRESSVIAILEKLSFYEGNLLSSLPDQTRGVEPAALNVFLGYERKRFSFLRSVSARTDQASMFFRGAR